MPQAGFATTANKYLLTHTGFRLCMKDTILPFNQNRKKKKKRHYTQRNKSKDEPGLH